MNILTILEEEKKQPPIFAHVKKAVENASLTNYALIIRNTGSGKTKIGTEIIKSNLKNNARILWMCPAALTKQVQNDMTDDSIPSVIYSSDMISFPKDKVTIVSYAMEKTKTKLFTAHTWDVVIVDEFHKARNSGTIINQGVWEIRKKSKKLYALTATPFNNKPSDFFELVSLVVGKDITNKVLGSIKIGKKGGLMFGIFKALRKLFTGKSTDNPTKAKIVVNKHAIEEILKKYVDYMEPEKYMGDIKRPKADSSVEDVELIPEEVKKYKYILKNKNIRNKEVYYRMLLLSGGSAKIQRAVKDIDSILQNKNNRVLVFSNFVSAGLGSLSRALTKESISHKVYKGGMSKEKKNDMINAFKDGTLRTLLISPSGFEGLNLKGTTHVIVLDPHYNPSKTTQLISRGLRAGSKVEKVIIKHYRATSKKLPVPTVDEKIMGSSGLKKEKNKALEGLLKDVNKEEEEDGKVNTKE